MLANTDALRRQGPRGRRGIAQAANSKPPRKIGRHLKLLDCLTCDKCVPVCPNDANFTFPHPGRATYPVVHLHAPGRRLGTLREAACFASREKHQIGDVPRLLQRVRQLRRVLSRGRRPVRREAALLRVRGRLARRRRRPTASTSRRPPPDVRVLARIDGSRVRGGRRRRTRALPGPGFRGRRSTVGAPEAHARRARRTKAPCSTCRSFQLIRWLAEAVLAPSAVNYVKPCLAGAPARAAATSRGGRPGHRQWNRAPCLLPATTRHMIDGRAFADLLVPTGSSR